MLSQRNKTKIHTHTATIPFETNFSVFIQNIQSLKNKIHILESFLQENQHQAICLTETWIKPEHKDLMIFPGYTLAASYCRSEHKGGGASILLKEGLQFKERPDIADLSIDGAVECCGVEIKPDILLVAMYRPDRHADTFFDQLDKLLCKLKSKSNKHIIIAGDFNLNKFHNSPNYQRLINTMLELNLHQIIDVPTRETSNTATCIDFIFSNYRNFNVYVEDQGLSDHKSLQYIFKQNIDLLQNVYTVKRHFSKNNIDKFKSTLNEIKWNNVLNQYNDVNANYNIFHYHINSLLNKFFPQKPLKLKQTKCKPWLTKGLKKSCNHKRLLKTLINQKNDKVLKTHFKSYSKTLHKCINKSKKINYVHEMTKSLTKTKTMWHVIKNVTGKNLRKQHKNIELKSQNTVIKCPHSIANSFNEYFSSVSRSLPNNAEAGEPRGRPNPTPSVNSIFLQSVTEQEVHKIIQNLPSKYTCGIDEIPSLLVKICNDELTPPITLLINQSFDKSCFPDKLKIAAIKPILKKGGKPQNVTDYRPIALLPTISKIYEKCMANRVCRFLEKYHYLHENQFGFRKNRSTTLAVYNYIQATLECLRNKNYAIGLLLDLSKAYDRVSHPILLTKLYEIGVRGSAYDWFKSYLQNRQQYVEIDYLDKDSGQLQKQRSNWQTLNSSIPQGSVLGCILFLIYINDLPKITNHKCILFADDISLLFHHPNNSNNYSHIKETFTNISKWLHDHNLLLNTNKTHAIQFRPYQKRPADLSPLLQDLKIKEVTEFTLLGLTVDTHLDWKKHIDRIKSKVSSFIYALYILKSNTNTECALSAYHAYTQSWLRYGIILWGHSTDAHNIFIAQKKCVRILVNILQTQTCKPHFINLQILTLPSLYILEIGTFVRNNLHLYKFNQSARRRDKLIAPEPILDIYKKGPYYRSINIYNKLPSNIRNLENNNSFISKLKTFLIKKAYYSVSEFLQDDDLL